MNEVKTPEIIFGESTVTHVMVFDAPDGNHIGTLKVVPNNAVTAEQAEEIKTHLKQALELDPNNEAIKQTNAERLKFAIGSIETRIARGEFPTLSKLRKQHGIK